VRAHGRRRWLICGLLGFAMAGVTLPRSAAAQDDPGRKVRNRVSPEYPALARRMNIHGTVKLGLVVTANGTLKETRVIGGNPILVNAAMDAVKKWKFEPADSESSETVEFKFQEKQ